MSIPALFAVKPSITVLASELLRANRSSFGAALLAAALACCLAQCAAFGGESQTRSPQWGPDLKVETNTANTAKSGNLNKVVGFLTAGRYLGWPHDPYIRPTGDIYRTPDGELIDGTTHHRVRIYYSPSVATWLREGRPKDRPLPDRSMIVKEMYNTVAPFYPDQDPVIGWAAMVKKTGAAHDGWYWVIYFKPEFRSMSTVGEFSYSFCLTCHASTKSENTFSALENLTGENALNNTGRATTVVADPLFFKDLPSMAEDMGPMPLKRIDREFRKLFSEPGIYPYTTVPKYAAERFGDPLPSTDWDHVWNRVQPADKSYLTSDNCIGCHDATLLVDTQVPNMLVKRPVHNEQTGEKSNELLNLSVYGEWRSSPMGMAGRDPIFFAQLESEAHTYPEHADEIENLCLSCHGAMGQRQYQADRKRCSHDGLCEPEYFQAKMVFQTGETSEPQYAKYGALARDGISCMICHQMDPESISGATTGKFTRGRWDVIHGSTSPTADPGGPIRPYPMQQALGFTPKFNPYVLRSEMCGTCHVIELPVYEGEERYRGHKPVTDDGTVLMSKAHEQDTYLEWLYSAYQNSNSEIPVIETTARTCQDCHMKGTLMSNPAPRNVRLANVQDTSWPDPPANNLASAEKITVPVRAHTGRHTFFGMNLFVLNMYRQFDTQIFGLVTDPNPPMQTVNEYDFAIENGLWQIRNRTARVTILDVKRDGADLVTRVRVTNKAGHRLPSGVGFRRAWIEFTVLDDRGHALWQSGATNSQGAIVDSDGVPLPTEFTGDWKRIQPHWEEITQQDQVQIYEERYINKYVDKQGKSEMRLTSSFLGIGEVVKDNRLQPLGYQYDYIKSNRKKLSSLLPVSKLPRTNGSANPNDDPDYTNGSGADTLTYRIPLDSIERAAIVRARLNYQNIPPYYLRDRFAMGRGPQTQRLYYLVGHTDTMGTGIEDWRIRIAGIESPVPQQPR